MPKKRFTVFIEEEEIAALEEVAKEARLTDTAFGAMVLANFSQVRPQFALDALAAVKRFSKRGPGRPPSPPAGTDQSPQAAA